MEEKKKSLLNSVRIRTVDRAMLFISCILYIALIAATIHASIQYEDLIASTRDCIDYQASAMQVSDGSDYLMEQVQLYAMTTEPRYVEDYFTEVKITRRRERAVEQLDGMIDEEAFSYLRTAMDLSNQLMDREMYSMKLITTACGYPLSDFPQEVQDVQLSGSDQALDKEAMLRLGRDMVLGPGYMEEKEAILDNINRFIGKTVELTDQRQQKSAYDLKSIMMRQQLFISLLFVLNIVIFALILHLVVRPLQVYIKCIKDEKKLEVQGSYELRHLALTYNDIYDLNVANRSLLRHQAEHDPLTGIMNRGAFDQLKQLLKAEKKPLALLIIDVDRFKQVNDGYGHETGDQVLKKVAELLGCYFRSGDLPARIGGDEFAVIATDITPQLRSVLQDKVQLINEALLPATDGLPPVSLSVGIAFSERGFSDSLYKKADLALYEVKRNGRCGYHFYEDLQETLKDTLEDALEEKTLADDRPAGT